MATVVDELIALLGYDIQNEEDLKRFNKSLDGLEKKAYAVGQAMGKFAAIAATAVAAGVTLLGNSVINTSAKFETYAATLETIEGSADKATKALDWIADFAKTTPYEVDELTASFVKLRSYGMDPMDGMMTTIGDTAAGMGKSLNQVVEAMADASTFQFERLRELGVVASQAGDKVTFSWTENGKSMTKTIKKTSSEVTKFLTEVWTKKFGGAMIRQSKTWTGMMSNLGDSWTDFQRRIGDAGFFDTMKNRLADVMDTVAKWNEDGTIDAIATNLSAAFTAGADVVGIFADRAGRHISFLVKNFETLKPWLIGFGLALAFLVSRAFPVLTALSLLGLVIEDLLTYFEGGESVIGNFIKKIQELTGVSDEVAKILGGLGTAVAVGLGLAFTLAPATMAGLTLKLVKGFVLFLGPALVNGIAGLATLIAPAFAALFAFLATPVGWAVILAGVAAALVAYFWDDLVRLWGQLDFAQLGRAIGEGILNGLNAMSGAIAAWFEGILPGWAKQLRDGGGLSALLPDGGANNNSAAAGDALGRIGGNALKNIDRMSTDKTGAATVQDNREQNVTNNINTTVNQNVQQATAAPGAAAQATGAAVTKAAQPARMQTSTGGGGAF